MTTTNGDSESKMSTDKRMLLFCLGLLLVLLSSLLGYLCGVNSVNVTFFTVWLGGLSVVTGIGGIIALFISVISYFE